MEEGLASLDYELLGGLGAGSFGQIYLARGRKDGQLRAVKRLAKARIMAAKQVDHALSEVQVLRLFKHPFAV
jgi:protein kinase X